MFRPRIYDATLDDTHARILLVLCVSVIGMQFTDFPDFTPWAFIPLLSFGVITALFVYAKRTAAGRPRKHGEMAKCLFGEASGPWIEERFNDYGFFKSSQSVVGDWEGLKAHVSYRRGGPRSGGDLLIVTLEAALDFNLRIARSRATDGSPSVPNPIDSKMKIHLNSEDPKALQEKLPHGDFSTWVQYFEEVPTLVSFTVNLDPYEVKGVCLTFAGVGLPAGDTPTMIESTARILKRMKQ